MSELLSTIDVVPAKSSNSSTAPPFNVNSPHVSYGSTNSLATVDTEVVSRRSPQVPLDLEDGGLKKARVIVVISALTGISFLSSLTNGFIAIGLPRIASDLSLPTNLIIWPSAVYP